MKIAACLLVLLTGCSTLRVSAPDTSNPLVTASCPARPALDGDTFGDWVLMANTLAGMYDQCRAAALAK